MQRPDIKRLAVSFIIAIALLAMVAAVIIRISERSSFHADQWEGRQSENLQMLDKPPELRKD